MTMDWRKAIGKALTRGERNYLKCRAAAIAKEFGSIAVTIVNIGVFRGASLLCLHAGSSKFNPNLVGVDVERCPVKLGIKWRQIIGDSTKCHKDFNVSIHLLFIDGNHHYAYVLADLDNWASKVVEGGVVVLHDCHPKKSDVRKNRYLIQVNQAVEAWLGKQPESKWKELDAPDSLRAFKRES